MYLGQISCSQVVLIRVHLQWEYHSRLLLPQHLLLFLSVPPDLAVDTIVGLTIRKAQTQQIREG